MRCIIAKAPVPRLDFGVFCDITSQRVLLRSTGGQDARGAETLKYLAIADLPSDHFASRNAKRDAVCNWQRNAERGRCQELVECVCG
jgi:hypothetical protein